MEQATNNQSKNSATFGETLTFIGVVLALILLSAIPGWAQQVGLPDAEGKPIEMSDAVREIDGSIYISIDWSDGTISRSDNEKYYNLKLRYDEYDDQIVFENSKNESDVPVFTDVNGFTLKDFDGLDVAKFKNGFPAVDNLTAKSFYEVLCDGKIKLLKHYAKTITEVSDPGATSTTKSFKDEQDYYILKNGAMTAVKRDEKDILAALTDKEPQIATFIKSNRIKFKNDADLGKLFDYYNTLE
ncbi:hypothetical protein KXQ82_01495 [Mucilaginibacter sp. HMF5004]|uniref:hypothetical protein n=1 Tax=Mucilaginibacter rivuli TaxID=2857527 RepID=UPI001C5DA907|nr:hypothetical protein [Mucilaginibacter rivuli]MBW4888364.1 hypothetical protein [Mucilaginibacter rivuli]